MKRMTQAGWPVAFIPGAQVTHLGGASGDSKAGQNPRFYEGQDRFIAKHFGSRGLRAYRAANVVGAAGRALAFAAKSLASRGEGRARARRKMRQALWLARRHATHPVHLVQPAGNSER